MTSIVKQRGWSLILHVVEAEVCGPHSLRLVFDDGTQNRVNLLPLLEGPIFELLRDPAYFARVSVDPICRTVVWPNGADLAPEALYELSPEQKSVGASSDISSRPSRFTDHPRRSLIEPCRSP